MLVYKYCKKSYQIVLQVFIGEIRRGTERLYRKARNDLQNFNQVRQLIRFLNKLRENQGVFDNKILKKIRSLVDMSKMYYDENVDGEKQLVDLRRVNDLTKSENIRIVGGNVEGSQTNSLQQSIDEITRKRFENNRRMLKVMKEVDSLNKFVKEINSRYMGIIRQARGIFNRLRRQNNQHRGLTPRSIRRFRLFTADLTRDDQCQICLEDVRDGRRMRRLTCDGHHAFCKVCYNYLLC